MKLAQRHMGSTRQKILGGEADITQGDTKCALRWWNEKARSLKKIHGGIEWDKRSEFGVYKYQKGGIQETEEQNGETEGEIAPNDDKGTAGEEEVAISDQDETGTGAQHEIISDDDESNAWPEEQIISDDDEGGGVLLSNVYHPDE